MKCFYCDKDVEPEQPKFWLGLDKPYINLLFHKECYNNVDAEQYVQDNVEKIFNVLKERDNGRKRKNK